MIENNVVYANNMETGSITKFSINFVLMLSFCNYLLLLSDGLYVLLLILLILPRFFELFFFLNCADSSNEIIVDGTAAGEEAVDIKSGSQVTSGPQKQGEISCSIKIVY